MKYQVDETGRLPEKPKYSHKELNDMAEKVLFDSSDILGKEIQYPIPTDKLTVIIERYVEDLDLYADFNNRNLKHKIHLLPPSGSFSRPFAIVL